MSNKTQLQTNNTALDGYIARINAAKEVAASLPDASGGGGNIETCTLNITNSDNKYSLLYFACETLQDGVKTLHAVHDDFALTGFNFSVPNVICDSFCYSSGYEIGMDGANFITDNVIIADWPVAATDCKIFRITAPVNGVASIDFRGTA